MTLFSQHFLSRDTVQFYCSESTFPYQLLKCFHKCLNKCTVKLLWKLKDNLSVIWVSVRLNLHTLCHDRKEEIICIVNSFAFPLPIWPWKLSVVLYWNVSTFCHCNKTTFWGLLLCFYYIIFIELNLFFQLVKIQWRGFVLISNQTELIFIIPLKNRINITLFTPEKLPCWICFCLK